MSEPAILARRLTGSQVWSMEKLENKLIDMREMYQEYKDRPLDMMVNLLLLFLYAPIINTFAQTPLTLIFHSTTFLLLTK